MGTWLIIVKCFVWGIFGLVATCLHVIELKFMTVKFMLHFVVEFTQQFESSLQAQAQSNLCRLACSVVFVLSSHH